jgi:hypothetical protein
MNVEPQSDLREFHLFVGEVINRGSAATPEDVLDQWRLLHPSPEEQAEDLAAIAEAIEDIERGDMGVEFSEFDRDFRARHGIRPRP